MIAPERSGLNREWTEWAPETLDFRLSTHDLSQESRYPLESSTSITELISMAPAAPAALGSGMGFHGTPPPIMVCKPGPRGGFFVGRHGRGPPRSHRTHSLSELWSRQGAREPGRVVHGAGRRGLPVGGYRRRSLPPGRRSVPPLRARGGPALRRHPPGRPGPGGAQGALGRNGSGPCTPERPG